MVRSPGIPGRTGASGAGDEFLAGKVGGLPAIDRIETAPIIKAVKQASAVMAATALNPLRR